jgi:hypothetical protein
MTPIHIEDKAALFVGTLEALDDLLVLERPNEELVLDPA